MNFESIAKICEIHGPSVQVQVKWLDTLWIK